MLSIETNKDEILDLSNKHADSAKASLRDKNDRRYHLITFFASIAYSSVLQNAYYN